MTILICDSAMKGSPSSGLNKCATKMKLSQISPKKKDKHPGTGGIDHAVCVINGTFANDSNGNKLARKWMGNICKEVRQLCIRRRKSSYISNCPIRRCSGKSRFIASIFQALTVRFYSNFSLEYLIGLSPIFPPCMQCNKLKQEVKLKRNEKSLIQ